MPGPPKYPKQLPFHPLYWDAVHYRWYRAGPGMTGAVLATTSNWAYNLELITLFTIGTAHLGPVRGTTSGVMSPVLRSY